MYTGTLCDARACVLELRVQHVTRRAGVQDGMHKVGVASLFLRCFCHENSAA